MLCNNKLTGIYSVFMLNESNFISFYIIIIGIKSLN